MIKILINSFVIISLFNCASNSQKFASMVKNELNVQHAFPIPSEDFSPGMVLAYNSSAGYQKVCSGWVSMELSKEDYIALIDEKPVATVRLKDSSNLNINLDLTAEEKALMKGDLKNLKSLELSLSNGKVATLTEGFVSIVKNLKNENSKCMQEIQGHLDLNPGDKIYVVRTLYRYDIEHKLKSDTNSVITADLTPQEKEIIKAKLAASGAIKTDFGMSGKGLGVGFSGSANIMDQEKFRKVVNASSFNSLKSMLSSGAGDSDLNLDITSVIKRKK